MQVTDAALSSVLTSHDLCCYFFIAYPPIGMQSGIINSSQLTSDYANIDSLRLNTAESYGAKYLHGTSHYFRIDFNEVYTLSSFVIQYGDTLLPAINGAVDEASFSIIYHPTVHGQETWYAGGLDTSSLQTVSFKFPFFFNQLNETVAVTQINTFNDSTIFYLCYCFPFVEIYSSTLNNR